MEAVAQVLDQLVLSKNLVIFIVIEGEGRGLGLAIHHSFRSYVATVIDVEVQGKDIKVHDAYVVLDCGTHINPDTCVAQMEGAVVFGLSLALKSEITFDKGSAVQGNLDTYELIRMIESP